MTVDDWLSNHFKDLFHSPEKPVTDVWVGAGDEDELIVNVEFDDMDLNFHQQAGDDSCFVDQHGTVVTVTIPEDLEP